MRGAKCLVGIPTLNGPDRLRRCLAAIRDCTDFSYFDVKVLVADDGSTPENLEANKSILHQSGVPGVELLHGHGRTGIAATWNRLVRHDRDSGRQLVVLVNDDVEVVDDWLDVLAFSVLNNAGTVGMVGLNSYVGRIKENTVSPPRVDFVEAKLTDGGGSLVASHGPIFAFDRRKYDFIGGFDERYFCFYEEVDFGVALRQVGYRNVMASYPIVYHMGGATNSDPKNLDAHRCMTESRQKFGAKWGATIDQIRDSVTKGQTRDSVTVGQVRPGSLREWNSQWKVWRDE